MVQESAAPGHVLAERYRLETLLGEGGFGTVWRAEHLVLEAPVAINSRTLLRAWLCCSALQRSVISLKLNRRRSPTQETLIMP